MAEHGAASATGRILIYLATAVAAVVLAWGVSRLFVGDGGPVPVERREVPRPSGRTASFHVGLQPEEGRRLAVRLSQRLAAEDATELTALKEDLVLLMTGDPEVMSIVLEAFERQAPGDPYQAAAFADLFSMVRSPLLVEPVRLLLRSEDPIVLPAALRAAITQADPGLTPELDRIYREFSAKNPIEGQYTRQVILRAATICGGDQAPLVLERGLSESDAVTRRTAVEMVRLLGLPGFRDRLRRLLQDPDPSVRLESAVALASLGDREGRQEILGRLAPASGPQAMDAATLVRVYHIEEAREELKRWFEVDDPQLFTHYAVALMALGDEEARGILRGYVAGPHPSRELGALTALAATGAADCAPLLRQAMERGGRARLRAIATGLALAPGQPDPDLVKGLFEMGPTHPIDLGEAVARLGDGIVPWLEERARAAGREGDEVLLTVVISCLNGIATPRARSALLGLRDVHPRLVGECLRVLDLERAKSGSPE